MSERRRARKAGRRSISDGCCCGCASPASAIRSMPSTPTRRSCAGTSATSSIATASFTAVCTPTATKTFAEGRLGYEEYAAAGFRSWGFTTTRASSLEPTRRCASTGSICRSTAAIRASPARRRRSSRCRGCCSASNSIGVTMSARETDRDAAAGRYRDADLSRPGGAVPAREDLHGPYRSSDRAGAVVHLRQRSCGRVSVQHDRRGWRPPAAIVAGVDAGGVWSLGAVEYRLHDAADDRCRTAAQQGARLVRRPSRTDRRRRGAAHVHHEAVVLEALLYKAQGPLFESRPRPGYFDLVIKNEFARPPHCLPQPSLASAGAEARKPR